MVSPPSADPVREHQYGKPTRQVTGAGSNEKSNRTVEGSRNVVTWSCPVFQRVEMMT